MIVNNVDFSQIVSLESDRDHGGNSIILTFTNGAKLSIFPDNDAIHYSFPDEQNIASVILQADLDGDHKTKELSVLIDTKNITVAHVDLS